MVDQVKLNDDDMICHLMKVSSWLHNTALFPVSFYPTKSVHGPQIVFAYSVIGLTIALYSFRNSSLFKSVIALLCMLKHSYSF